MIGQLTGLRVLHIGEFEYDKSMALSGVMLVVGFVLEPCSCMKSAPFLLTKCVVSDRNQLSSFPGEIGKLSELQDLGLGMDSDGCCRDRCLFTHSLTNVLLPIL